MYTNKVALCLSAQPLLVLLPGTSLTGQIHTLAGVAQLPAAQAPSLPWDPSLSTQRPLGPREGWDPPEVTRR